MTFDQKMLSSAGQEAVLRLQSSEIRVLQEMQSYLTRRINVDKHYSRSLSDLVNNALRFKPDIKTPMFEVRPIISSPYSLEFSLWLVL